MQVAAHHSQFDSVYPVEIHDLNNLYLSPLNPRQDHEAGSIELLAESLVACGLMQNLGGVRDSDGRIAIVFGGRRLAALQIAVSTRPDLANVPVLIAPDHDTALLWGGAENVAREDMTAAQEIAAYARMRDAGSNVSAIASAFAVTENHVYRRLKLATLAPEVLDALRENKINLSQAQAFTVSENHALTLTVLEAAIEHAMGADAIKRRLTEEAVEAGSRKAVYVGLEAYQAAGGGISRDLFGDNTYLTDTALLDQLFTEKLTAVANSAGSEWAWVEVCDTQYFDSWSLKYTRIIGECLALSSEQSERQQYLAGLDRRTEGEQGELEALIALATKRTYSAAQKAAAGVVYLVNWNGDVVADGPYVRKDDQKAAVELGVLAPSKAILETDERPKSAFSMAVKDEVGAVKLHAMQAALVKDRRTALALLAFSMAGEPAEATLLGLRREDPKNAPSERDGFVGDPTLAAARSSARRGVDLVEAFTRFAARTEDEIIELLLAGTMSAAHLNFGTCHERSAKDLFGHLWDALSVNPRLHWTPTRVAFWGRMPAAYLDEQFLALTGLAPTSAEYKAFAAQKKGGKADDMERLFTDPAFHAALGLTAEQVDTINTWMPEAE